MKFKALNEISLMKIKCKLYATFIYLTSGKLLDSAPILEIDRQVLCKIIDTYPIPNMIGSDLFQTW